MPSAQEDNFCLGNIHIALVLCMALTVSSALQTLVLGVLLDHVIVHAIQMKKLEAQRKGEV